MADKFLHDEEDEQSMEHRKIKYRLQPQQEIEYDEEMICASGIEQSN
jgi:hypothetical protein